MRLYVRVFGAEDCFRARDGQPFRHVDELAPAVVALARIPFSVLVGHHRAGGFEHGPADEVSDAMSSSPLFCRCSSSLIACAISGSVSASERQGGRCGLCSH